MIISPLENAHQSLKDTPKDIEYILVLEMVIKQMKILLLHLS